MEMNEEKLPICLSQKWTLFYVIVSSISTTSVMKIARFDVLHVAKMYPNPWEETLNYSNIFYGFFLLLSLFLIYVENYEFLMVWQLKFS